jgi:four helix bundle protein
MTNKYKREFDLEDRTVDFSSNLIKALACTQKTQANLIIINQLLRSGTSIGANYHEANEAMTPKDFKNLIRISKKEAKETIYWLKLLINVEPLKKEQMKTLLDEASQLVRIFASIYEKKKE